MIENGVGYNRTNVGAGFHRVADVPKVCRKDTLRRRDFVEVRYLGIGIIDVGVFCEREITRFQNIVWSAAELESVIRVRRVKTRVTPQEARIDLVLQTIVGTRAEMA